MVSLKLILLLVLRVTNRSLRLDLVSLMVVREWVLTRSIPLLTCLKVVTVSSAPRSSAAPRSRLPVPVVSVCVPSTLPPAPVLESPSLRLTRPCPSRLMAVSRSLSRVPRVVVALVRAPPCIRVR